MAEELLSEISQEEIERIRKDQTEMALISYYTELAAAKRRAHQKGIQEGRQKGMQEGRMEGRTRLVQAARNMKADGLSTQQIQRFTGLTEDEY